MSTGENPWQAPQAEHAVPHEPVAHLQAGDGNPTNDPPHSDNVTFTVTSRKPPRSSRSGVVLVVVFIVCLLAGLAVMIDSPQVLEGEVALARTLQEFNHDRTSGAPQQTVVNGWETNDLLEIIANNQAAISAAKTQEKLLLILIISVSIFGLATSHYARSSSLSLKEALADLENG